AVTSPVVRAPPVALTAARQFRIRTGFPGAHRRIWFGEQTSTIIQAVRCDRGLTHACGTSLVREPVTPADSPGARWATGSADEGGISVRTWRSAVLGYPGDECQRNGHQSDDAHHRVPEDIVRFAADQRRDQDRADDTPEAPRDDHEAVDGSRVSDTEEIPGGRGHGTE